VNWILYSIFSRTLLFLEMRKMETVRSIPNFKKEKEWMFAQW